MHALDEEYVGKNGDRFGGLFLPETMAARRATDIYTSERIEVRSQADGRSLHLDLQAGQGRAIRLE